MTAALTLAEYALSLQYDALPVAVRERAAAVLADAVGVAAHGASLPWSAMIREHAAASGGSGPCAVFGTGLRLTAPMAALANGAAAHAFELDSLIQPSVGVHPGATVAPAAVAAAQQSGASGREMLAALVAGCEVACRIGAASHHSSEKLGFHAPGLTGVFGAAVAAGRLFGLDAPALAHALGIAGSLCSGVIEFSQSGGMVKRLHPGRAAEGGVLAASLARRGYTGPARILEGRHGYLQVYCRDGSPELLTAGLGTDWHTLRATIKRYACHITAQVPVAAVLALRARHGFAIADVAGMVIEGSAKMVRQHDIAEPADLAMAQYSVPFCAALATRADLADPAAFSERSLADPEVRELCRRVELRRAEGGPDAGLACRVALTLRGGAALEAEMDGFPGTPHQPLGDAALAAKFATLAAHAPEPLPAGLLDALRAVHRQDDMSRLRFA